MTSEVLARRMSSDPAVVQRTMAGLRDAGIVRSEKGRDVYEALGITDPFTIGVRTESPRCFVEQAVNRGLVASIWLQSLSGWRQRPAGRTHAHRE